MCLTIPKQVITINKGLVQVKSSKGREWLNSIIKVKKGNWVLSQNNVIIKKISPKQAKEIDNLLSS